MIASVIIATRNRCERLATALRSFEKMTLPETLTWELIVVDNGSTDATAEIVRECQRRALVPLRYVCEASPGKSVALNTGLKLARGEILAFTDDDCVVAPDWLTSTIEEFAADPTIAGIGGRVELYDPSDQPYTIRTRTTREEFSPGALTYLVVGCNMAFRRSALDRVGEFDPTLGPGSRCCAAEDFDLLYRAYMLGLKIVYVPEVLVYHNHGRKTEADIRRLYVAYGISQGAFYGKFISRGDIVILAMMCRHVRSILYSRCRDFVLRRTRKRPNTTNMKDLFAGVAIQVGYRSGWLQFRKGITAEVLRRTEFASERLQRGSAGGDRVASTGQGPPPGGRCPEGRKSESRRTFAPGGSSTARPNITKKPANPAV